MEPSHKRRKYFIAPRFQLKYIGIMVSAVLASGFIMSAGMYATIYLIVLKRLPEAENQRLVIDVIFAEANKYLLVAFPVAVFLMVIFGVFLSHKISGPEYRIRKILEDMKDGNLRVNTKLRKGDELQSIAGKLQEVNKSLGSLIKVQKKSLVAVKKTVTEIKKETEKRTPGKAELSKKTAELSGRVARLSEALDKFKVS